MSRWQVVRQTSSAPDRIMCTHRLNLPAELHARWLERHGSREDRDGAETTQDLEKDIWGVFYTVRRADAPPVRHLLGRRCVHGTRFPGECPDCPGGRPVIPDVQTETDQPEAEEP